MFGAAAAAYRTTDFFADLLARDDSAVFVADAGGVVGIAHGLMRSAPELPIFVQQRWGVLDSLVVDPTWHRRGVGRLLAQSVEEWALSQGAQWVELSVYGFNVEARRFYEALGYLPLRTTLRKGCSGASRP
jgi:GNAT superfamily N-acetyltransferase